MSIRPRHLLIGGILVFAAGCSEPTAPPPEATGGFSANGLGYGSGHDAGVSITGQATAATDSTGTGRGGLGYGSGH